VDRLLHARHALPVGVLVFFGILDVASGPRQVVVGLFVISPLLAASVLGRRATAAYGVVALVLAALLGVYGHQYEPGTLLAQSIRLFGVAVGSVLAVVVCTLRLRREAAYVRARAEAAAARSSVELAERLQRSLLTDPPAVPGLAMAVRYLPAVEHAQVGGDWYDAFPLPSGATMLVIGDVAGHDVVAATTMAQARGVLRGIAQTVPESPAAVLTALDRALQGLGVRTLVTATVAVVCRGSGGTAELRWSNAGHPPPVLVGAGGSTVLERDADLLLGVDATAPRRDHRVPLPAGGTLVLYTDGLVERRGVPLDAGTAWLADELAGLAGRPLEELCDGLLADVTERLDDVAVLAVRMT